MKRLFNQRLTVLLCFLTLFTFLGQKVAAQMHFTSGGGTANAFPLNSATNKVQWIYMASDFSGTVPAGNITHLYFKASAALSVVYNNLTIKMGYTALTNPVSGPFATPLTTNYFATSTTLTTTVAQGWFSIQLTTPFLYDGTSNFIVEMSQEGTTSGGMQVWQNSGNGVKRLYGNVTAPNGTAATGLAHMGIDISPAGPCVNPPSAGTATATTATVCAGNPVTLNLTGNTLGTGLTYEWESAPSNTPFVPTSISAASNLSSLAINPTTTLWYRAKLICNGGTPVYSVPVQVQVLPALAGGIYTINNGLPTGGVNYNSFSDAVAAMQCGILGAITFNVTPGTPYVETVNIGNISGASATNTIRFNGNGAIVQFDNTTSERQLLTLDGAKYVTFDSLTFKGLNATYGWGALITNGSTLDTITRCFFDLTAVTSVTAANVNGIIFSGSTTTATTSGLAGTYCYIGKNRLLSPNGTGGMNFGVGIAAGGNDNNIIKDNIIENYYNNGIYISTAKNTLIQNNEIHRTNKTASIVASEGISTVSGDMSGSKIIGNRIHSPAGTVGSTTVFRGLSLLGDGTAAEPVIVANNAIYNFNQGGASSGIYMSIALYNKIYHNTVSIDKVMTGTAINYGIYATGANTGVDVKNNIVSITGGTTGIKYGFYYNTAPSVEDAQKNNIYMASTQAGVQNYGYYTAAYLTQAAFQIAYPALELTSPVENPQFVSVATGDLTPSNTALFATGVNLLTDVPRDIINVPRSPAPTPGAYELTSTATNDAGVLEIVSPSGTVCTGSQPVTVRVMNGGINTINNVQIHWTLNGVAQTIVNFTTPIYTLTNPLGNTAVATLGNVNFTTTPVEIKAWTYLPNGVADTVNVNDTITVTMAAALSGTFTVNSAAPTAGTNYQTFTALANDLNTYGVCAAVTVNVTPGSGPYNEFVTFNNIPGSSTANTIKINGNGATIEYINTTTNRQLLTLNGVSYLSIDSLTFKALNTDFGWGALITNGSSYDSITRCVFDLSAVTSIASANTNGITFSASNTAAVTAGVNGRNCYIANNHILGSNGTGGPYYGVGIAAGGNDSNVVKNNEIENYYYSGVYMTTGLSTIIDGNNIHKTNKTASISTNYAIYVLTSDVSGTKIVNNRIHDPAGLVTGSTSTFYGIYLLGDGTAANPVLVANNIVYNVNQGGIAAGIYLSTAIQARVYHNTIVLDKVLSGTSLNYGIYSTGTATGTEVKNNNVSITAGTTGIKYGFYYATAASISDVQRNNIYVNSTQTGVQNYGYLGVAYLTQAAFQTAQPTLELGSVAVDPQFIAPATGNLSPTNYMLFGNGVNLSTNVPNDIIGATRGTMPTPGAYEIPAIGNNNAGSVNLISPKGSFCAVEQPVSVSIVNAGLNNITNLKIHWQINGVNQPVYNYTATLSSITAGSGQFIDTVLLGNALFTDGVPNVIKVWTHLPNNVADVNTANDTIEVELQSSQFIIDAVADTLCINGSTAISLTPSVGYEIGNLVWQSSADAVTWADITNTDAPNYNATAMTADQYFRVKVMGGLQDCYSDTVKVLVADPEVVAVHDSARCGPGSVVLIANVSNNTIAKWYDSPTATTPIATGVTFTTPLLAATTTYYVAADIGSSTSTCRSALEPVVATVNPLPIVDLGSDIFSCVDAGSIFVLDAGVQPNGPSFLWDDASTSQVRAVDQSGQYSVTVTNSFGCATTDTANLTLLQKPVVELGNDTSVCIGTELTLDAGDDGDIYFWNTGASSTSIVVDDPGTYNVTVSSTDGCVTTDTISVTMAGQSPTIAGIQSNNNGNFTYTFNLVNPQNVVAVEWNFGDGTGFSYDLNPTYTYPAEGVYLVQVKLYSTCGSSVDSLSSNIVSVSKLNVGVEDLLVFPNPTTEVATLQNKGNFKMESVAVYNILGQLVYANKADNAERHELKLSTLSSGVYTIQVKTDKGIVVRRLEILK